MTERSRVTDSGTKGGDLFTPAVSLCRVGAVDWEEAIGEVTEHTAGHEGAQEASAASVNRSGTTTTLGLSNGPYTTWSLACYGDLLATHTGPTKSIDHPSTGVERLQ